jgi:flagellar basal-body rod protein FlgF
VEGIPAGTLKIVSFKDTDLLKAGNNLFSKAREDVVEGSPGEIRVMQGYIEKSNVNPVKMMTDMIDTLRGFESYQKVIQYLSETTTSAINKVGETF